MMSFGNLAVDQHRTIQRWPAASLLTGLLGNAMGYQRTEPKLLERLQSRLRWAARIDRPGEPITDFQTAQLGHSDLGWTTGGKAEGRAGSADTYNSPHIRWRDYRADASVAVAVRLEDADELPSLVELAAALKRPARSLFIGRKNCVPSQRVLIGLVDATDVVAALDQAPMAADSEMYPAVFLNDASVHVAGKVVEHRASEERQFSIDVHAGMQTVREFRLKAQTVVVAAQPASAVDAYSYPIDQSQGAAL